MFGTEAGGFPESGHVFTKTELVNGQNLEL